MTFSVIIPTCDRPEPLARAMRSVTAQTFAPDEIIVVDNGTEPVSPDILPEGVSLERLPPRVGVSRARNAGAAKATGDYLAFLDDDDEWRPDYLERMQHAIQEAVEPPDLLVAARENFRDGQSSGRLRVFDAEVTVSEAISGKVRANGSAIVVRRAAFRDVDGFDEQLPVSEDRAFIVDLLLAGGIVRSVPEAVVNVYRESRRPHLLDGTRRIEGKRAFYRRYRHIMGWRERLRIKARILRFAAEGRQGLPARIRLRLSRRMDRWAEKFAPVDVSAMYGTPIRRITTR